MILNDLPDSWKVTVTVENGGGRNDDGDPITGVSYEVPGCLIAPKVVSDENNQSAYADGQAILHMPTGYDIDSSSTVTTPKGSVVEGKFSVDGMPMFWPHATEVHLNKEG